jgi:hypothetical protein
LFTSYRKRNLQCPIEIKNRAHLPESFFNSML